ncbi:hypothetical protein HZZ13_24410 [Bradyrhizobium sp. CNPSo 4010]|uniref:Uncharacterized protein n=1 Tax=Bradyrhizobium agreste TaxID=2751811 RepID=A0ABS0PUL4_9BRAD|nr:hypothetical protein [Bradyrhizobium agreste]MBH5400896.1 hypothetical protein [Bradyrhizobium agreste]
MSTRKTRDRSSRSWMRCLGASTDEELALGERPIAPMKGGGSKRTIDMRELINSLMDVPSGSWSAGEIVVSPFVDSICASLDQSARPSHGH